MTELKYLKDIARSLDGIYKELKKQNQQLETEFFTFADAVKAEQENEDEQSGSRVAPGL